MHRSRGLLPCVTGQRMSTYFVYLRRIGSELGEPWQLVRIGSSHLYSSFRCTRLKQEAGYFLLQFPLIVTASAFRHFSFVFAQFPVLESRGTTEQGSCAWT